MNSTAEKNSPFVKRLLTACAAVALIVALALLAVKVSDIILLVFGAILVAVFLHGLANVLRRFMKLSEGLSVLLVAVLLIAVLAAGAWLLAPSVVEQAQNLRVQLPIAVRDIGAYLSNYGWGETILEQMPSREQAFETVKNSNLMSQLGGVFSSATAWLTDIVLLLLMAIYLAYEPQIYIDGLTKLFPANKRLRAGEILTQIGRMLGQWLVGKGVSMIFTGVVTWLGLWLLGIPLALTLGLIAGLLSFIPNFGFIISAVPAILLAFTVSPSSALYVLMLFVVARLVKSSLITPLIERKTVELPPALTIAAQLALTVLLGAAGLILATPILAVIMVLVQTVYIQDVLGDKAANLPESEPLKNAAVVKESAAFAA